MGGSDGMTTGGSESDDELLSLRLLENDGSRGENDGLRSENAELRAETDYATTSPGVGNKCRRQTHQFDSRQSTITS
eukprot:9342244-Pyramimonas_sp.AAC.1